MELEWDTAKATANLRKHRVAFEEAASLFGDPLAITFADPDHSRTEERCADAGSMLPSGGS